MYVFDKRLLLRVFIASVLSVVVPQMAFAEDIASSAELQTEFKKLKTATTMSGTNSTKSMPPSSRIMMKNPTPSSAK